MSTKLSALKKKKETELSQQFSSWLNEERGRQVKGIEFFLNKRSENIDQLIVETITGAESAINGSIEHYTKKLEFLNGPKVVKTFDKE